MSDDVIHDLAVAYAMAKLLKSQQEHPEGNGYNTEIRSLIKNYYYALHQIPEEDSSLDEYF